VILKFQGGISRYAKLRMCPCLFIHSALWFRVNHHFWRILHTFKSFYINKTSGKQADVGQQQPYIQPPCRQHNGAAPAPRKTRPLPEATDHPSRPHLKLRSTTFTCSVRQNLNLRITCFFWDGGSIFSQN
jgi:hypothetical protein